MSYARWGEDGSDVYVYGSDYVDRDNKGRVVPVWICMHVDDEGSFSCKTPAEMLAHLREHEAKGDTVPARAFERLTRESEGA